MKKVRMTELSSEANFLDEDWVKDINEEDRERLDKEYRVSL